MQLIGYNMRDVTVKPAVAVSSIKRDPPLNGHFRVPPNDFECKCTSIQRAPVQRGQRSAKLPQNAEIVYL